MNRRTYEGPMDWEYQDRGPVDATSPFAQVSQRSFMASFDSSPTKPSRTPNPFAPPVQTPARAPPSPSKQLQGPPPGSSIFNPQIQRQFTGSSFRNPAFTTPQKRFDESVFSECEESPAMTDTSEIPVDTPDDRAEDFAGMTITPASINRTLFARGRTPGRGEIPRGKGDLFSRDKVRKRKRQWGDKDVGSVRSRLPHGPAESESEWDDDTDTAGRRSASPRKKKQQQHQPRKGPGFIGSLFTAIHDHPSVPLILSWWVQLGINVFIVSVFMWLVWSVIAMMRADIASATDAARSRLLAEMEACAHEYTKNLCAPKSSRLPALNVVCDEWELCMNQDPSSVMKLQVSAKNVAEIINEFVGVMSVKAWGFILSTLLIMMLANNIGFSRFREHAYTHQAKEAVASTGSSFASQAAGPPPMLSSSQDPNQAYIWAPIGQTPRHIRKGFFHHGDATDTDASPSEPKSILPPPQTPSQRRSPSKTERGRSPTKYARTPSRGY